VECIPEVRGQLRRGLHDEIAIGDLLEEARTGDFGGLQQISDCIQVRALGADFTVDR